MNPSIAPYRELLDALTYYLRIFGAVIIIAETGFLFFRFKKLFLKETLVNLMSGVIAVLTQMVVKTYIIFDLHMRVYDHFRIWDFGIHWYSFAAGFIIYTFIQFSTHFLNHKIRFFWCLCKRPLFSVSL